MGMRRTEARAGWSLAFLVMALVGCGLEPNPSPLTEPGGGDGWSDAADATDGTDGGWPGTDLTDGVDGQADATDGTDGAVDWSDGADGADTADGSDGNDGVDDVDASDATDGVDATDGADATDGWDGTDGVDESDATDGSDGTDAPCPVPPPPGPLAQAPGDVIEVLDGLSVPSPGELPPACATYLGDGSVNERLAQHHEVSGGTGPVTLGPESGYGRVALVTSPAAPSRVYALTSAPPTCSEPDLIDGPAVGCQYTVSGDAAESPCDYGLVDAYEPVELAPGLTTGPATVAVPAPVGTWRLELGASVVVRDADSAWLCGSVTPESLPELAGHLCAGSGGLCTAWVESTSCLPGVGCKIALRAAILTADRLVLEDSP
jgi:hypothetical protein